MTVKKLNLQPDSDYDKVESLVESCEKPDPALDAMWLKEAEDRIAAYRAGELEAVDAEEVFAELVAATEAERILLDARLKDLEENPGHEAPCSEVQARLEKSRR